MNGAAARRKGRDYQRHVFNRLRARGLDVSMLAYGGDTLVVTANGQLWHVESKCQARLQPKEWNAQAEYDAGPDRIAVVAFKIPRRGDYVLTKLDSLMDIALAPIGDI